jgi:hypothetical protein
MTKYEYGDMTHVCPEGQPFTDVFSVEMRSRAKLEVLGVMYDTDPSYSLLSWWAKSCRDAELSGRIPLLLTHVTRGIDMIWAPVGMYYDADLDYVVQSSRSVSFRCPWRKVKVDPGKKGSTYIFPRDQHVLGVPLDLWEQTVPVTIVDSLRSVGESGG